MAEGTLAADGPAGLADPSVLAQDDSDPSQDDNLPMYLTDRFAGSIGYHEAELLDRNYRFLQGDARGAKTHSQSSG